MVSALFVSCLSCFFRAAVGLVCRCVTGRAKLRRMTTWHQRARCVWLVQCLDLVMHAPIVRQKTGTFLANSSTFCERESFASRVDVVKSRANRKQVRSKSRALFVVYPASRAFPGTSFPPFCFETSVEVCLFSPLCYEFRGACCLLQRRGRVRFPNETRRVSVPR